MTSESGGSETGGDRYRGRFARHAKAAAVVLAGIVALFTAVGGMIALVCRDPEGDPASAVTTTVAGVQDTVAPSPTAGPTPAPTSSSAQAVTLRGAPPAPAPQWEGDVRVDALGYSLATVPPSPDQSGRPDISAAFDGTVFAGLGAARWTATAAPSPRACAPLILAQNMTHVTAVPGDVYCVRVAHSTRNPGNQYAAVLIIAQGRDSTDFPYLRIHATVWPDQQ
ncbi:hypothetical protein ABH926_000568 [Catenulispora sp. GP43]|uniref:hypothetical protein n=1 Tax=Catenulispora sp. GP43 TaxID=3156263 RepID=UPI0035131287